ncbi:hypothetical protein Landi51_12366 [Colletotrichum acutatum]
MAPLQASHLESLLWPMKVACRFLSASRRSGSAPRPATSPGSLSAATSISTAISSEASHHVVGADVGADVGAQCAVGNVLRQEDFDGADDAVSLSAQLDCARGEHGAQRLSHTLQQRPLRELLQDGPHSAAERPRDDAAYDHQA